MINYNALDIIVDSQGFPASQYYNEEHGEFAVETTDGSVVLRTDVDFRLKRLILDSDGFPLPQLWSPELGEFVPRTKSNSSSGGNGNDNRVIIKSILDIEGDTFGQKINNAVSSGVKHLILEDFGDYSLDASDHITYRDITITGNGSTIRSFLPGKQMIGSNVSISDVKFVDVATSNNDSVFTIRNSNNIKFEKCEFTSSLKHVFRVLWSTGSIASNIKIAECKFNEISLAMTLYGAFDNIVFDGNEFSNVSDNVISFVGEGSTKEMTKKRFVFKNNIVHNCERMIVEIKRSNEIYIENNDFRNNGWYTLSLIGCNGIFISGNKFNYKGIELGPESGTEFPAKNIRITDNTFSGMINNSIIINSGTTNSVVESVLITGNNFSDCPSEVAIDYAGERSNIKQLVMSQNIFYNAGAINVLGVFQNNNVYSSNASRLVECFNNSVLKNNIFEISNTATESNSNIIKISGNDIIIDDNILHCNSKVFSGISDFGASRQNLTVTNNRIYNGKNRAVSFNNNTTFLNTHGNLGIGNTNFDGDDFDEAKALVQNFKMGIYQFWGNPNSGSSLNNVARGSMCIDTENGKLYVKENTASPYWVLK